MAIKRTKSRLSRIITYLGIPALVFVSASIIHSGEIPEQTDGRVSWDAAEKTWEKCQLKTAPLTPSEEKIIFGYI